MPEIVIIDYGMGNLFSVRQACIHAGLTPRITSRREEVLGADAAILPGVGAFADAMQNLSDLGLIDAVRVFIKSGRPFMGVCLGMQLLFSESEEFGVHPGLDIFPGRVVRFGAQNGEKIKVPQVGWNAVCRPVHSGESKWDKSALADISDGEFMYFVHSFHCRPQDTGIVLSTSEYCGIEYCSSVSRQNIFACQFHPERSGVQGLRVYQNFSAMIDKGDQR